MITRFKNNSDLCHVFAQRTQSHGNGSNLFFEYDKMYSYGYHFLLAEYIDSNTILINNRSYSSSTAKHQSLIRQATRQYKQYFTKEVEIDLVHSQIMDMSKRLLTARKKDVIASEIVSLFESCKEFSSKYRPYVFNDNMFKAITVIYNEISVNKDQYIAAAKEREAKELVKLREKLEVDLKKFLNHEINHIDSKKLSVDFIRLSLDLKSIETSQGVKIPIKEATELYKMIQAKIDVRGVSIGGHKIASLNGVLSVGCHRIDVENMHKIGQIILN